MTTRRKPRDATTYKQCLQLRVILNNDQEKNLLVLFFVEGVRTASDSALSFFSELIFSAPKLAVVGEERSSRERCVRRVATCRSAIVRDESTGVYSTLVRRCSSVWCEPPAVVTGSRPGGVPATASPLGLGVSPSLRFLRHVGELIELARSAVTPTTEPTLHRPRVRLSAWLAVASRSTFRRSYLSNDRTSYEYTYYV